MNEQIKCPECDKIQNVYMEKDFPLVHECEECGYVIMESEWEYVTPSTPNQ